MPQQNDIKYLISCTVHQINSHINQNNIVPFIIDDELKLFYYRGLREWKNERSFLMDTCLAAQDKFKTYLDYFRVPYEK